MHDDDTLENDIPPPTARDRDLEDLDDMANAIRDVLRKAADLSSVIIIDKDGRVSPLRPLGDPAALYETLGQIALQRYRRATE